jgi:hypothetical protein
MPDYHEDEATLSTDDAPSADDGNADLTLTIRLGEASRTLQAATAVVSAFNAWTRARARGGNGNELGNPCSLVTVEFIPASEGHTKDAFNIDLSRLIPHAATPAGFAAAHPAATYPPRGELDAHLDALQELLDVMHIHWNRNGHQAAGGDGDEVVSNNYAAEDGGNEEVPEDGETCSNSNSIGQHDENEEPLLSITTLWRLGGLKNGLGLDERWISWMRYKCMGRFVKTLGSVWDGIGTGWPLRSRARNASGAGNSWRMQEDQCEEADELVMERALNVCLVFGWDEEYCALAERLAYVCAVEEDPATGERFLTKPDGERVAVNVCGRKPVGEWTDPKIFLVQNFADPIPTIAVTIIQARDQIIPRLLKTAKDSLCSWTRRIGQNPCQNDTCNANRIAALNTFLAFSSLYPGREDKLERSLREILDSLRYITASDAELRGLAMGEAKCDTGPYCPTPRPLDLAAATAVLAEQIPDWAVRLREMYGGTCVKCNNFSATSMLFPLMDLLSDLCAEIEDLLGSTIGFQWWATLSHAIFLKMAWLA